MEDREVLYTVTVQPGEAIAFVATVNAEGRENTKFPVGVTQGNTREELFENVKDIIEIMEAGKSKS